MVYLYLSLIECTMNTFMILCLTSLAGFSTMLGNILLIIPPKYKKNILSFSLGLSFCVMFLVSILELIPEGLILGKEKWSNIPLFGISLLLMSFGAILVILINAKIKSEDSLYKVGFLSMLSLLVHNIPEGVLCVLSSLTNTHFGLKMILLILIHNIPEGICISLPIYYATKNRKKAILYTFISGLGELSGALLTIFVLHRFINNMMLFIVFLFTAGIMIYLSTFKILKEAFVYKKYLYLLLGILLGVVIIILTL